MIFLCIFAYQLILTDKHVNKCKIMEKTLSIGVPYAIIEFAHYHDESEVISVIERVFELHDQLPGLMLLCYAEKVEIYPYSNFIDFSILLDFDIFGNHDLSDLNVLLTSLPFSYHFSYLDFVDGHIELNFHYRYE